MVITNITRYQILIPGHAWPPPDHLSKFIKVLIKSRLNTKEGRGIEIWYKHSKNETQAMTKSKLNVESLALTPRTSTTYQPPSHTSLNLFLGSHTLDKSIWLLLILKSAMVGWWNKCSNYSVWANSLQYCKHYFHVKIAWTEIPLLITVCRMKLNIVVQVSLLRQASRLCDTVSQLVLDWL